MSTVVNGFRAHLNAHFLRNPAKSLRPSKAFQLRGMRLASGISATRRYIFFLSLRFPTRCSCHLPLSSLRQLAASLTDSRLLFLLCLLPFANKLPSERVSSSRVKQMRIFRSISGAATVLPRKENWYLPRCTPPSSFSSCSTLPFPFFVSTPSRRFICGPLKRAFRAVRWLPEPDDRTLDGFSSWIYVKIRRT